MKRLAIRLALIGTLITAWVGSTGCDDEGGSTSSDVLDLAQDAADAAEEEVAPDADAGESDIEDEADADQPDIEDEADAAPIEFPCDADESDILCVGTANRVLTPPGYETVNPAYLRYENTEENPHACFNTDVLPRCGTLSENQHKDCGSDGLCDGDADYPGPDEDGSEGDGAQDWYYDCGMDRLCPGDEGYVEPDADGTEANGHFDGFWIAGFNNNRPMAGVLDDIWARALVLHHDGDTIAFFVADLIGFHYDDFERVRARYREKYPDDHVDYLLMQSTHVHEVADTVGLWGPANPSTGIPTESGIVGWWLDWVIEQMVDAVHEAYESQQRAELWVGEALTGVEGLIRDSRPPTVIDDRVRTMQFRAESSGDVIATTLHWANHPEAIWSDNNLQSSDFAHYLRTFVGDGLPARGDEPAVDGVGGNVLYMQGAIGGLLAPPRVTAFRDGTETTRHGPEVAEAMGEWVALAAFDALESAERIDDLDGIRWISRIYYPVVENVLYHIAFLGGLFGERAVYTTDGEPYPYAIITPSVAATMRTEQAVIRFGPSLTWYTYPGELFPELAYGGYDGSLVCGWDETAECSYELVPTDATNPPPLDEAPDPPHTEALVPGEHRLLLGLAMDEIGYLVPAYDFEVHASQPYMEKAEGSHYEETNSIGPESAVPDLVMRELAIEAEALYEE